jgi:hypothetical protein
MVVDAERHELLVASDDHVLIQSLADRQQEPVRLELGPRFMGVQLNVPEDLLSDWVARCDQPYSQGFRTEDLHDIPPGTVVFVGARSPSGHIALGAWGERDEVLRVTEPNKPHLHNGAFWYNTPERSFGFSKCPIINQRGADSWSEEGEYRLSWCLRSGGGRAGEASMILNSGSWRKLVYYKKLKEDSRAIGCTWPRMPLGEAIVGLALDGPRVLAATANQFVVLCRESGNCQRVR